MGKRGSPGRIDRELWQWGADEAREMDWHSLPRMSVVEKILRDPGFANRRGHQVLCRDRPAKYREVSKFVERMPHLRKTCVKLWYCFPVKEDGRRYAQFEIAGNLGISLDKFRNELKSAKRYLTKALGWG